MILKKGNQVKIIAGKDKGKTGEILEIDRKFDKVKIKSIYMIKRHTKPTKETTSTSDELASIEKFPSKSVVVPLFVPLTIMVAPGKGPSSLETVPVIVCAITA